MDKPSTCFGGRYFQGEFASACCFGNLGVNKISQDFEKAFFISLSKGLSTPFASVGSPYNVNM